MRVKYPRPPGLPPWTWDPNLRPSNREDYITIKCKIYNTVKTYDLDLLPDIFKEMLKDKLPKDRSADMGGLPEIINQMMDDWRKAAEARGATKPKDEDCDQEPPAPAKKKPRLIVEPRTVTVKQGGDAVVKVSVVDRPYHGMIQVELRDLPQNVTARMRAIYDSPDYTEIRLEAAADAPPTTKRSVFADGYYQGESLKSDMFTVIVE